MVALHKFMKQLHNLMCKLKLMQREYKSKSFCNTIFSYQNLFLEDTGLLMKIIFHECNIKMKKSVSWTNLNSVPVLNGTICLLISYSGQKLYDEVESTKLSIIYLGYIQKTFSTESIGSQYIDLTPPLCCQHFTVLW